jgi:glycerol uptake facilitator-like aquaporin
VALNLFVYLLIAIIGSAIGMLLLLWMVSKEWVHFDDFHSKPEESIPYPRAGWEDPKVTDLTPSIEPQKKKRRRTADENAMELDYLASKKSREQ